MTEFLRKILCFLMLPLLLFSENSYASYEKAVKERLSIAINCENALFNENRIKINAPILAFGKTYVDLYEIGTYLGCSLEWVEEDVPYVKVVCGENETDFTIIKYYDELKENNKFFVKDERIFVAARDLALAAGTTLSFKDWVIGFGLEASFADKEVFGEINYTRNVDSYLYDTYFYQPTHCVYPYQAYSYEFLVSDAKNLERMYPEIIKTRSIGKSVEGRDIVLIEFGKGEKKIFVCGTHHAREYISTTYLMYAIDRFCYMYETRINATDYDIKKILDNVTFCIVPMVNPDGVNLVQNGLSAVKEPEKVLAMKITEGKENGYRAWKANINGVDPNWNYDKDWRKEREKISSPASTGYNGEAPFSEPETRAVAEYVDAHSFEAFLTMHTQGKLLYWAEDISSPTNLGEKVRRDTGFSLIREDTPEKLNGVGGSFFDYVFRKYGKATMTVELCNYIGPKPYPDSDFDRVWKSAKNILLIFGDTICQ